MTQRRSVPKGSDFTYVRRPNLREHKKAGNLNYAFERTGGEHIVIFDAYFRPRADFLVETLPYMDDSAIGIVQTPQFFLVIPAKPGSNGRQARGLDTFYRAVQVSRDRLQSALCVGSNAVYRRAALETDERVHSEIPYAEDSHTGLDIRFYGYQLIYLPIPLAAGICPATLDAFMRQQDPRGACGATSLVWTSRHVAGPDAVVSPACHILLVGCGTLPPGLRTLILPLIPISPARVPPWRDLPAQRAAAASSCHHQYGSCTRCGTMRRTARGSGHWLIAVGWAQAPRDLGLLARQGHVLAADTRPRRAPPAGSGGASPLWNGTLAFAWLALAAWRIAQTGSYRFAAVAAFGVINALIVGRLIFPGKKAV